MLVCSNCPIEWNSPDFKEKLTVSQALTLLVAYTTRYEEIEEKDLCRTCRYISYDDTGKEQ